MRRIKITAAYDGTNYRGWQLQPGERSIEGEINRAVSELTGEEIKITGASRTDSGVHAEGNAAVFDTESLIPAEKFCYAINQRLPEDIRIMKSEEVSADFHPRRAECIKTYRYSIYNGRIENPLFGRYSYFCYYALDIELMKRAAAYLVGEHDFTSFTNPDSQALKNGGSAVREIYSVEIIKRGEAEIKPCDGICRKEQYSCELEGIEGYKAMNACKKTDNMIMQGSCEKPSGIIDIIIRGNGFLYNMIRIIAGTLIEVGRGHYPPEHIADILLAKDRHAAGPTAPAKGLTLLEIEYNKERYKNDIEK